MNLADIQGMALQKDALYHQMCKEMGVTLEQAQPYIGAYEKQLERLAAQYHRGVVNAMTQMTANLKEVANATSE